MSVISETAEAIGWHLHGDRWTWGVAERDGCALCDAAYVWMSKQKEPASIDNQLRAALAKRRSYAEKIEVKPMTAQERRADAKRRQGSLF